MAGCPVQLPNVSELERVVASLRGAKDQTAQPAPAWVDDFAPASAAQASKVAVGRMTMRLDEVTRGRDHLKFRLATQRAQMHHLVQDGGTLSTIVADLPFLIQRQTAARSDGAK